MVHPTAIKQMILSFLNKAHKDVLNKIKIIILQLTLLNNMGLKRLVFWDNNYCPASLTELPIDIAIFSHQF